MRPMSKNPPTIDLDSIELEKLFSVIQFVITCRQRASVDPEGALKDLRTVLDPLIFTDQELQHFVDEVERAASRASQAEIEEQKAGGAPGVTA